MEGGDVASGPPALLPEEPQMEKVGVIPQGETKAPAGLKAKMENRNAPGFRSL